MPVFVGSATANTQQGCVGEQLYNAQFGFYECTQVGNNVHKFEPATGKWTMLAPMPRARYRHTALAFNGEKITVFGGRTAFDDVIQEVDEYDIRTNVSLSHTHSFPCWHSRCLSGTYNVFAADVVT